MRKKFKESTFIAIVIIYKKRYIINNACCRRKFIDYVYSITQTTKITNINIFFKFDLFTIVLTRNFAAISRNQQKIFLSTTLFKILKRIKSFDKIFLKITNMIIVTTLQLTIIIELKIIFVQLIQIRIAIISIISLLNKMIIIQLRRCSILKCRFVKLKLNISLSINFKIDRTIFINFVSSVFIKTIKIKIKSFYISFISSVFCYSKINFRVSNNSNNSSSLIHEICSIFNYFFDFCN